MNIWILVKPLNKVSFTVYILLFLFLFYLLWLLNPGLLQEKKECKTSESDFMEGWTLRSFSTWQNTGNLFLITKSAHFQIVLKQSETHLHGDTCHFFYHHVLIKVKSISHRQQTGTVIVSVFLLLTISVSCLRRDNQEENLLTKGCCV